VSHNSGQKLRQDSRIMKLESLRGFAAVYVFLHHAQGEPIGWASRILSFGQEAVILFFLLSGFVIHRSTCVFREKESFGVYFLKRVRRIYPLFVLALLFSYSIISLRSRHLVRFDAWTFTGNLLMLQGVSWVKRGTWFTPFSSNSPLWSLSYEWWFYMLFYPIIFLIDGSESRRRLIIFGSAIGNLIIHQFLPNQISLFLVYLPIWWCGVDLSLEFARSGRITWRGQGASLLILGLLTLAWGGVAVGRWWQGALGSFGFEPILQLRHFLAALTFIGLGVTWNRYNFFGFEQILGPFKVVAPISYAIYIFHGPLLDQYFLTFLASLGVSRTLGAIGAAAFVIPLSYVLEIRLQMRINCWTNHWIRRLTIRCPPTELMPVDVGLPLGARSGR
jgi:peptidoglycan/LPS O-acetylase OafA/YrhL